MVLFVLHDSMACMKALGASTKAFASASGRSNTMPVSISPPAFLIRAGLPACIRSRIATALFHTGFVLTLLLLVVPVIHLWWDHSGRWVASAERNALSGNVAAGTAARAGVTARRMSLSFTS